METAIIGLPLSGKTTLFNALTGQSVQTSAYTGGAREVHVADVSVPDERVDALAEVFHPRSVVHASVRFKDVPAQFAPDGGMEARTIADLRAADALTIVVRAFEDDAVPHPQQKIDPLADYRSLIDSLVFSDFAVADKRRERLEKEGKKNEREYARLEHALSRLEEGLLLGDVLTSEDLQLFSGFAFLTAKPIIVVANTGDAAAPIEPLNEAVAKAGLELFPIHGQMELEISSLPPSDQGDFLAELGLDEPASRRFLQTIYRRLDLISFLTAGEDEVRAWSIGRDTPAVEAAGRIHSDLQKGFIRAEVVRWDELASAGGFKEAKTAGKTRLEGKDYVVVDGDVLTIRFNV